MGPMSGGSYVYLVVREEWPDAQSALATARHILASCGTFVSLGLRWRTSRLDAVERARPLLATAAGFAEFTTEDPDRLTAAIITAGTASKEPTVASTGRILDRYDRIPARRHRCPCQADPGYRRRGAAIRPHRLTSTH
jgi:hypothetical protein